MTVQEFALRQLHNIIQRDPWVQTIMLAAGYPLDRLAEMLVEAWGADDFDALTADQCQRYERMLALTVTGGSLEDRRSAIQAAWRTGESPNAEMLQSLCDSWRNGEVAVSYDYSTGTVTLTFTGEIGVPDDIIGLKNAMVKAVPAHIKIEYAYHYYSVADINELTIAEINQIDISTFAGGGV